MLFSYDYKIKESLYNIKIYRTNLSYAFQHPPSLTPGGGKTGRFAQ